MIQVSVIISLYRGLPYLEGFLAAAARQTIFSEAEFVIVHNDPLPEEIALIETFGTRNGCLLKHIVVPRENLYASWNRGVAAASSDLLAIWNVDDIRPPDSLARQVALLQENPDVALTYGDHIIVDQYGATEGRYEEAPEFDPVLFSRKCKTGPFVAFRKSVLDQTGPFDEQFRATGDYDCWVRIAHHFPMKKTPGPEVGYFLNGGQGLSTNASKISFVERNVVNIRYGNFGRITWKYMKGAEKYRVRSIRYGGTWHPVSRFIPDYEGKMARRKRYLRFRLITKPLLRFFHIRPTEQNQGV